MTGGRGKRTYPGTPPKAGPLVAGAMLKRRDWSLFIINVSHVGKARYLNMKLIALGECPHKANFWLAYDIRKNRMIRNKSSEALLGMEYGDKMLDWVSDTARQQTQAGRHMADDVPYLRKVNGTWTNLRNPDGKTDIYGGLLTSVKKLAPDSVKNPSPADSPDLPTTRPVPAEIEDLI